jgi:hypothetical protein
MLIRKVLVAGLLVPTLLMVGCKPKTDSEAAGNQPGAYVKVSLPAPTPGSARTRLTNPPVGVVPHVIAQRSNFVPAVVTEALDNSAAPEKDPALERLRPRPAPELIPKSGVTIIDGQIAEKDWTGITLIPKKLATSLAFTTKVAVQYIEVHPLANGTVRIWARLNNLQGQSDKIEIGCSFRTNENPESSTPTFYQIELPKDYIDVFFVSPKENINAYTFLVRDLKTRDDIRRGPPDQSP